MTSAPGPVPERPAATGPLDVHPDNPRYFRDAAGRAVYLTGSHHWDSLVDNAERPRFDFGAYLDLLARHKHNFLRLWTQEAWHFDLAPLPFARTGPGLAADGGPRFDLTRFDPEYFSRLRQRVEAAGARGFYVSVMLFQGWSLHDNGEGNPWPRHSWHRGNNVNGIDGDPRRTGDGTDLHTLRWPELTRLQERYVERVADEVGDLPHVLYEISNESPGSSREWQEHMVRHLREHERGRGRRHPIGMTFAYPGGTNEDLFRGPADWISPGRRGGYMKRPPPADGSKVILADTDHLWGIGGDRRWVWRSFLAGLHPIYMDPLDAGPERESARQAMGHTLALARRLDLAATLPAQHLASTGSCLADRIPGRERLIVYLPRGRARLDLRELSGDYAGKWLDPATGAALDAGRLAGGRRLRLRAPVAGDAVLWLERQG